MLLPAIATSAMLLAVSPTSARRQLPSDPLDFNDPDDLHTRHERFLVVSLAI